MKVYKFLDMVKTARLAKKYNVSPTARSWPLCLTCGREVSAAELKNVNNNSLEIWVRCHGKEDFCRIDFPFRMEDPLDDERGAWAIKRAMHDYCPFDPKHTENARIVLS